MSSADGKQPGNVARGLKASIHNDNVSDEAKLSAAQRLEQMGEEVPADFEYSSGGGRNTGRGGGATGGVNEEYDGELNSNQIRGYKSTLARGNVSREAKEHARQVLEGNDATGYVEEDEGGYGAGQGQGNDESRNRKLGGYKATLKNPNVSEEAKEHAQDVLEDAGAI